VREVDPQFDDRKCQFPRPVGRFTHRPGASFPRDASDRVRCLFGRPADTNAIAAVAAIHQQRSQSMNEPQQETNQNQSTTPANTTPANPTPANPVAGGDASARENATAPPPAESGSSVPEAAAGSAPADSAA
jgi:hypothetical protein